MKIEFGETFAKQVGARTIEDFDTLWFGPVGSKRRYRHERNMLKTHIKEAFAAFLLYPLRLVPWGHIAETMWFFVLTRDNDPLEGIAFQYINDAYVVGLRDAIRGKRHKWPVKFHPDTFKPYGSLRYPLWLLTRLVWPLFRDLDKNYKPLERVEK